jgi:hypothetical protein
MTKAEIDKVIAQAKSWLGINEYDNRFIEIVNVYNEIPGARGPALVSYPWCAIFVSAVFWKAIKESRFAEMACDAMIQKFQNLGLYSVSGKPDVGDVIFYDWDSNGTSDHVGIVTEVADGAYIIIEGNKSDAVGYRTIYPNYPYIKGFGFASRLNEENPAESAPSSTVGQQMADKIVANRRWPTLKLYSKGEWVTVLQAMLNAENKAGLDVDGEFGVFTYSAVNKFQTAHGLERDGIVGPLTWGELKK